MTGNSQNLAMNAKKSKKKNDHHYKLARGSHFILLGSKIRKQRSPTWKSVQIWEAIGPKKTPRQWDSMGNKKKAADSDATVIRVKVN